MFGFRDLVCTALAVGDITQHQRNAGFPVCSKPGVFLDLQRARFVGAGQGRHDDLGAPVSAINVNLGQMVLNEIAGGILGKACGVQVSAGGIVEMQDLSRLPHRNYGKHCVLKDRAFFLMLRLKFAGFVGNGLADRQIAFQDHRLDHEDQRGNDQ